MPLIWGWKDPFTQDEYLPDDPRLIGRHCPPTVPMAVGHGVYPMTPVEIDTDVPGGPERRTHDKSGDVAGTDGKHLEGNSQEQRDFNATRP